MLKSQNIATKKRQLAVSLCPVKVLMNIHMNPAQVVFGNGFCCAADMVECNFHLDNGVQTEPGPFASRMYTLLVSSQNLENHQHCVVIHSMGPVKPAFAQTEQSSLMLLTRASMSSDCAIAILG